MIKPDQYAVFGHPIKHSKSPEIHRQFAIQTQQNIVYTRHDVAGNQFVSAANNFFNKGGRGLNCTVPLKELAWAFADKITQRARYAKAVNTLARQEDGSILGDNTDGVGLIADLASNHQIKLHNISILLLGAGGASRGILESLLLQHPKCLLIANRTTKKAVNLAAEFSGLGNLSGCGFDAIKQQTFDLIINATSASLSGCVPPLPVTLCNKNICYDLAYASMPTVFVRWGQKQGAAKSLDGLGMLVEQAAEAFYLWRGVRPQTNEVIMQL